MKSQTQPGRNPKSDIVFFQEMLRGELPRVRGNQDYVNEKELLEQVMRMSLKTAVDLKIEGEI